MDLDNQLKTEHGIHHGIHFPILSPSWRDSEPDVICNPYMDGTFDTEFRRMNNNSGDWRVSSRLPNCQLAVQSDDSIQVMSTVVVSSY